jgi:hypothetical protein
MTVVGLRHASTELGRALKVLLVALCAACSETVTEPVYGSLETLERMEFSVQLQANAASAIEAAQNGRSYRDFEDVILRMEGRLSGLGGLYIDSAGSLVAYVRDTNAASAALVALRGLTTVSAGPYSNPLQGIDRIELRAGRFAFSELVAGMSALAVAPIPSLVTIDADETTNRIVVSVSGHDGIGEVYRAAKQLGIPDSAVRATVRNTLPRLAVDLAGRHRPTLGGVVLSWQVPFESGFKTCSLGYNVSRADSAASTRLFITASHCVKEPYGIDLNPITAGLTSYLHQPGATSADLTGNISYIESWNPTDYPARWNEAGCNPAKTKLCIYSDVAQLRYLDGIGSTKAVAKTARVNDPNATDVVATFGISGLAGNANGTNLDKMGYRTGWTRGRQMATCVDIYTGGLSVSIDGESVLGHRCVNQVWYMNVRPGDSGAPVFWTPASDAHTVVGAVGIVIAFDPDPFLGSGYCGTPCSSYYTPWSRIERNLQMPYGGGLVPY